MSPRKTNLMGSDSASYQAGNPSFQMRRPANLRMRAETSLGGWITRGKKKRRYETVKLYLIWLQLRFVFKYTGISTGQKQGFFSSTLTKKNLLQPCQGSRRKCFLTFQNIQSGRVKDFEAVSWTKALVLLPVPDCKWIRIYDRHFIHNSI